jgi:hypothetical protein
MIRHTGLPPNPNQYREEVTPFPVEMEIAQKVVGATHPATFVLDDEALQSVMNRLWELGFRPKNGEGNVGHIGAVKDHLSDMQKLVFENLLPEITKGGRRK